MMIALPNLDGSYTCTCFWPWEGENGFAPLRTPSDVTERFRRIFPDAVPLMPTLTEDFFRNPTAPLVTIRCRPWSRQGRVVLLGDACHAVVPFYGQGANAAFEDCSVLAASLSAHPGDLDAAFTEYERRRKENTDALADLALDNFVEMRDKTASRLFHLGKRVEHGLHRILPRWYLPLYSMISFSTIPYARARRRARLQDRVVRLCALAAAVLLAALAVVTLR
jgi:kynurenine 3-monooxygenase